MTLLINGYKALNSLSGGKLNKFILKNSGKLLGGAVNKFSNYFHKPQWSDKVSNVVNNAAKMATESLGSDNELAKNLNNASTAAKGGSVSWANLNDDKPSTSTAMALAIPGVLQPYVRNVGGSNFKRYVRHKRPKFAKKKKPFKRI